MTEEKIGVVGLGYVGLPVAIALGRAYEGVVGFDINESLVGALEEGRDLNEQIDAQQLKASPVEFTTDPQALADRSFYVVTVPTPIDEARQPDLSVLESACRTVGPHLEEGDVVVFESTVYPGVTREHCAPLLEEHSGLKAQEDFKLGYSPERVNPGDKVHTLEKIVKVVSGQDAETLQRVAAVYEGIIEAGIHRAPSIEVAEAAKVIENTQRDLNIALMNELALIFDRMGLRTKDVLEAAGTKWNFLGFHPGLVGGHCIGVDPYYLTHKAEKIGYHPQMILAGRRINDGMSRFVAQRMVKLLIGQDKKVNEARVGILGLTFKANVGDLRNSRVPEIVEELSDFGITCRVHDPLADPEEAHRQYGLELVELDELGELDGLVVAVAHDAYRQMSVEEVESMLGSEGVLVDVKSIYEPDAFDSTIRYWSL